ETEQIDDDRDRERGDADAAYDHDPGSVVDDRRVPGALQLAGEDPATGECHEHAHRAGDRAGDRRRPEDADWYELLTLEFLRIFRPDDQDVDEKEHHR